MGVEVVEIVGKKGTPAKVFQLKPEDEGKGIIRVDGLVRRNLGVGIGDSVEVRKAEVLAAERVTIAPIIGEGHDISFGQGIENFVKRGLLNRPVTKGDVVIVPGIALMGGALPFKVIKVMPKGIVQVVDDSIIEMMEEPVREGLLHMEGLHLTKSTANSFGPWRIGQRQYSMTTPKSWKDFPARKERRLADSRKPFEGY